MNIILKAENWTAKIHINLWLHNICCLKNLAITLTACAWVCEIAAVGSRLGSEAYLWDGETSVGAAQSSKNRYFWPSASAAAEKGRLNYKIISNCNGHILQSGALIIFTTD